jgi:hypothetical protein
MHMVKITDPVTYCRRHVSADSVSSHPETNLFHSKNDQKAA